MDGRELCITRQDRERLGRYLSAPPPEAEGDRRALERLAERLGQLRVVEQREIGPLSVTMNSRVWLRDIDTKEDLTLTLVFPEDADIQLGKLSVLSAVGTALLGRSQGDVMEWRPSARGLRRILVKEVRYQPEAAGNFSL